MNIGVIKKEKESQVIFSIYQLSVLLSFSPPPLPLSFPSNTNIPFVYYCPFDFFVTVLVFSVFSIQLNLKFQKSSYIVKNILLQVSIYKIYCIVFIVLLNSACRLSYTGMCQYYMFAGATIIPWYLRHMYVISTVEILIQ